MSVRSNVQARVASWCKSALFCAVASVATGSLLGRHASSNAGVDAASAKAAVALSGRSQGGARDARQHAAPAIGASVAALTPPPPAAPLSSVQPRWRRAIESFAAADRERPPLPGGIVVIGSSSISLWHGLESQFPAQNIVRRGLSGALMVDCATLADRLVLPYKPRLVLVYAGDNDLAGGVEPDAVLTAFVDFVSRVHAALPQTRIAFVSVKPSPQRAALAAAVQRTNALLAAYGRSDPRLAYIDVYTPMLNAGGQARADLFQPDGLHLNAAGYAVWNEAIAAHLN